MYFRFKLKLGVLLVCVAGAASGCIFGQDPPAARFNGTQIGGFQSDCLNVLPQGVRDYFGGSLQDEAQIGALWDCAISALTEFKLLVRGAGQSDVIPAAALVSFLNAHLQNEDRVSDSLRIEAMKLKAAVLGGSVDNIDAIRLDQTMELLRLLRRGSIALRTLMPLQLSHIGQLRASDLGGNVQALQAMATEVGGYIQDHGGDYAFDDFTRLLHEFEKIYLKNEDPSSPVAWILAQMPVLRVLKSVALGGSQSLIRRDEWSEALVLPAKMAGTLLLYLNCSQRYSGSWLTQDAVDSLAAIGERGVDHLVEIASRHPGGIVPSQTMTDLLETLQRMKDERGFTPALTASSVQMADLASKALIGKQLVFGGPAFSVDLSRSASLRPFIESVKEPLFRLGQILFQTDVTSVDEDEFAGLLSEMERSAAALTQAWVGFRQDSPRDDFATYGVLAQALEPGFASGDTASLIIQMVNLVQASRNLLLGIPSDGISSDDWQPLLEQCTRLGRAFLLSKRLPAAPTDGSLSLEWLNAGWNLAEAALAVLDTALAAPPGAEARVLYLSDVDQLIANLPSTIAQTSPQALVVLGPGVMKLKATLFGGNASQLGAPDYGAFKAFLGGLRDASYSIQPYFPLNSAAITAWSTSKADEAAGALGKAAQGVAQTLSSGASDAGGGGYLFADLDDLLAQLAPLMTDPTLVTSARDYLPILGAYKAMLLRPPFDSIQPDEWGELILSLGDWGALGLRTYHYLLQSPQWDRSPALGRGLGLVNQVFQNLRASAVNQKGAEIEFTDIDRLLQAGYALESKQGVTLPIRLSTVTGFLRPLARRFLAGLDFGTTGRKANGITPAQLDHTSAQVREWASEQQSLEQSYLNLGGGTSALEGDGYVQESLASALGALPHTEDLRALLLDFRPFFLGQDTLFSFVYDGARENLYSFNDQTKKNIYRLMMRSLEEGYADEPARARRGTSLTEPEFETFVADIHGLVEDLKFGPMDRPDSVVADQDFLEMDIFTSHGNGDSYLDVDEGLEFVGLLGSTQAMALPIFADAAAHCPSSGVDYYGRPDVEMKCFRQRFFDNTMFAANFTKPFPKLVSTFLAQNATSRASFMRDLEIAARRGLYNDNPLDVFQTEDFVMIMNFIESLFKRFDVDRQGEMTIPQALAAYPVICPTLKSMSGLPGICSKPSWSLLEALFGHLLVFGTVPTKPAPDLGDQIVYGAEFLAWTLRWATIRSCTHCSYRVDRPRILSIIEALAAPGTSSKTAIDYSAKGWGGNQAE